MTIKPLPAPERLRELLRYDPVTGKLFWRKNRRNNLGGYEAGTCSGTRRYLSVTVDGTSYTAHRIIWAMHHDVVEFPILDHINGNAFDNRLENLRLATTPKNGWNRGRPATNSSGYKGVCWHSRDKKWVAYIKANGERRHLGNYDDPALAHAAYVKAAAEMHGDFARVA